MEQSWVYKTWQELNGAPFTGEIGVHDRGGYSAELGVNQARVTFSYTEITNESNEKYQNFTVSLMSYSSHKSRGPSLVFPEEKMT